MSNISNDLKENPDTWKRLLSSSNVIKTIPQSYSSAKAITKLLLIKWLRPDTFATVIEHHLNDFFSEIGINKTQTANMSDVFKKSAAKTPIIIFKAPGCNVSTDILELADEMNAAER